MKNWICLLATEAVLKQFAVGKDLQVRLANQKVYLTPPGTKSADIIIILSTSKLSNSNPVEHD